MLGPTLPISQEIDAQKYRQEGESFEQSIERLTPIVRPQIRNDVFDLLVRQRFLPAGRIRNAVGADKVVTAFNCYVMQDIPDSLEGIMDIAKAGAMTMKMGGGTGYNFSKIRPKGDLIQSVGSTASGPVSYMHIYDATCATVKSAGERRGAMMFVLRVDHPDIEEYIAVKTQPGVLTNANLSIAVTKEFMQAVESGGDFNLTFEGRVYRTVKAAELWDKIMQATWDWAEPGVLFIDRINEANNLWYCETISATNPCAEQPLPENGACLLGSFNLVKYVYEDRGIWKFDYELFRTDIPLAVEFLDSVIDNTIYPLEAQRQEALSKRRMGIGVTGVANAIERLGYEYGSPGFLNELANILTVLRDAAYIASARLAKDKGAFPLFDAQKYLMGEFAMTLPSPVRLLIGTYGLRNSHLLSIAPTGTISLCADNVSSGIEPVFTHEYNRVINTVDGQITETVQDYAYRVWGIKGKTVPELKPEDHIRVLAVAQKYVDSAVSKTVNVGAEVTYDEFKDVYLAAYRAGAKGCTTFRANGKRMGILQESPKEEVGTIPPSETTPDPELSEGSACTFDPTTGQRTCG